MYLVKKINLVGLVGDFSDDNFSSCTYGISDGFGSLDNSYNAKEEIDSLYLQDLQLTLLNSCDLFLEV